MDGERLWVHGRPVRGFFGGLLLGLGVSLLMHQFDVGILDLQTAIVMPVAFAVVGAIRAWVGRAYKVATETSEPAPPPAAEA